MVQTTRGVAHRRPNILLVTTDDQGNQAGCYGDPIARTPNLDRFARQGVRFSRAYVTSATCSPSRSSMLTGLFPHQNGQIGLSHLGYTMRDGVDTLPAVLGEAGYRTGILGKLHVEPVDAFPFPFNRTDLVLETRHPNLVARQFNTFLSQTSDRPFFFMCNLFDPHPPYAMEPATGLPDPLFGPEDVRTFPWLGIETPEVLEEIAAVYNLTTRADSCFGALLAVLEERGLANDTLVIYIGDNGPNFAKAKTTNYEAGVHVPLVVRWPTGLPRRAVHHGFVSAVDLVPTICDATGVAWPSELPGDSLLPVARGESLPWRRFLCTEHHAHGPDHWFPRRSIRGVRYKLIENLLPNRWNPVPWLGSEREVLRDPQAPERSKFNTFLRPPAIELYDLARDPHEWNNLADDPAFESPRNFLKRALDDWRTRTDDPFMDAAFLEEVTASHDAAREAARQASG